MSAPTFDLADVFPDPCPVCGLFGKHAHQQHLWNTSNQDGSGRVRVTECAACTTPRLRENGGDPCRALLRCEPA